MRERSPLEPPSQGPDCLAEIERAGRRNIPSDSRFSEIRIIWSDEPDSAGRGFGAVQYRRRAGAAHDRRIQTLSRTGEGFAIGT